jgi:hypothetical protein
MQASRLKSGGETAARLLDDLCRPGALERAREGDRPLRDYVDAEARDLGGEAFGKLMAELHARVAHMMRRCGTASARCVRAAAGAAAGAAAAAAESEAAVSLRSSSSEACAGVRQLGVCSNQYVLLCCH